MPNDWGAYNPAMDDILPYADLAAALSRLGSPEEASEFHGTLCGVFCSQDAAEVDPLELLDIPTDDIRNDEDAEALLQTLAAQTLESLMSSEMHFAPLLPDDDIPLDARVQALALWCQGFLYGMSSRRHVDLNAVSEEAREIISDLSQFTQAGLEAGDDQEIEESAYVELVEYIRVGAQLVFLELNPATHAPANDDSKPTLH